MQAIIFDFAGVILDLTTRRPVTGVVEFVQQAHATGKKLAVASSSSRRTIEQFLQDYNLRHYFSAIVGLEDVAEPKPNPECFVIAAEQLGVAVKDCVVIDDTQATITQATAIGFQVIWFGSEIKAFQDITV